MFIDKNMKIESDLRAVEYLPIAYALFCKDKQNVIDCNNHFAQLVGAESVAQLINKRSVFFQQLDSNTRDFYLKLHRETASGEALKCFDFFEFNGEWKAYMTKIFPYYRDNKVFGSGIIAEPLEITQAHTLAKIINKAAVHITDAVIINIYRYLDINQINYTKLSLREVMCLHYIQSGENYRKIAERMNISSRTVETYLERIKKKVNLKHRSELFKMIIENGLTSIEFNRYSQYVLIY